MNQKKFNNFSFIVSLIILSSTIVTVGQAAINSASILPSSLVQGDVKSSMQGNSYAQETNALNDWLLDTGGWGGNSTAVSFTNANYNDNAWGGNPDTMVTFGNGGSVTLKLDNAIADVEGEKELGIFTAQAIIAANGALFNGNMEAAILLSSDGSEWFTLAGQSVSQHYIESSSLLNAPTMGYDFNTLETAWSYGSPGTNQSNLDSLPIADYTTPMPNDTLFNGSGTDGDRLAMKNNTSTDDYDAIFGLSGGGNWFDISQSGLDQVEFIQLNAVNCTSGMGIRLDAVFTTTASVVPEPTAIALLSMGSLLLFRKRK